MNDCFEFVFFLFKVVSLQQQRDGLPLIQSIQGNSRNSVPAGVQLSNEITWTKKKVEPSHAQSISKDTNAMASMLASRGIKITPKQKPAVNIPNLGSNISITATKSSSFNIPEEEFTCKFCVNKVNLLTKRLNNAMNERCCVP